METDIFEGMVYDCVSCTYMTEALLLQRRSRRARKLRRLQDRQHLLEGGIRKAPEAIRYS
jgi:23S rRNA U2552 (ribose-2'-O)-methylase RlmE/FtsJ